MYDRPKPLRWLKRAAISLVVAFFLLPPLYVLSVGPAWKLVVNGRLSYTVVDAAYSPLFAVVELSETAKEFYTWYVALWFDSPKPQPVPYNHGR
jgi:hypothetical protein